jgi:hypothetical protein
MTISLIVQVEPLPAVTLNLTLVLKPPSSRADKTASSFSNSWNEWQWNVGRRAVDVDD